MLGSDDAVAHVGHGHAVDAPGVVGRLRALGVVVGLLARLRAADVDAIHVDRRHRLHHDPGIAGARQVLQLRCGHVRRRGRAPDVDHRASRRVTSTVSAAPATRELHGERRARAAEHFDVAVGAGREAGQRHLDGVDADRQVQEVRLALGVGDLRLGRGRPSSATLAPGSRRAASDPRSRRRCVR